VHPSNHGSIQFFPATTNSGYFDNVGNTRRQGLDLSLGGKVGGLSWRIAYSFVDATYQSQFVVSAESNSTADANGDIVVHPGDRLPLVPRQTGRLVLDYAFNQRLQVGAIWWSCRVPTCTAIEQCQPGRGYQRRANTSPQTAPADPQLPVVGRGTYRLGGGPAVRPGRESVRWTYATAGFLASNTFTPSGAFRPNPDDWTNENAISPGAPRGIWAGVRVSGLSARRTTVAGLAGGRRRATLGASRSSVPRRRPSREDAPMYLHAPVAGILAVTLFALLVACWPYGVAARMSHADRGLHAASSLLLDIEARSHR
jgi:hypothetical protein